MQDRAAEGGWRLGRLESGGGVGRDGRGGFSSRDIRGSGGNWAMHGIDQIRGVTTNQMGRRAHTGGSKGERKQYRRKRGERGQAAGAAQHNRMDTDTHAAALAAGPHMQREQARPPPCTKQSRWRRTSLVPAMHEGRRVASHPSGGGPGQ